MTIFYRCDTCGQEFTDKNACFKHECLHIKSESEKIKKELIFYGKEPCDYCRWSYYVYGCEQDCKYKDCNCDNHHKRFVPVEPLHDKSIAGV